MDDLGCRIFNPRTKRISRDFVVRAKSKWTPEGMVLWLIAAAAATLIVCSQVPPKPAPLPGANDVEFEVEFAE